MLLKVMALLKKIVRDPTEIQNEENLDRTQCNIKIMYIHPEQNLQRGQEKVVNRTAIK